MDPSLSKCLQITNNCFNMLIKAEVTAKKTLELDKFDCPRQIPCPISPISTTTWSQPFVLWVFSHFSLWCRGSGHQALQTPLQMSFILEPPKNEWVDRNTWMLYERTKRINMATPAGKMLVNLAKKHHFLFSIQQNILFESSSKYKMQLNHWDNHVNSLSQFDKNVPVYCINIFITGMN